MNIQPSYPDITYIDTYIKDGKKAILSLNNFYETLKIEDINDSNHVFRIPWKDFFLKHRKELDEITQLYTIPETSFYKPKMVSLELYGTTELWLALLRVNNMKNISEFHYSIIKVYNPSSLMEIINIFFKREKIIT